MRIFWWNGGLHIEPENDVERSALITLAASPLEIVQIGQGYLGGPLGGPVGTVSVYDENAVGGNLRVKQNPSG